MAMARRFWGAKLTGDEGVDLPYNFAIWMRKVGELARFQQGPLRYNSNHATRIERVGGGSILITVRGLFRSVGWSSERWDSLLRYNSIYNLFFPTVPRKNMD